MSFLDYEFLVLDAIQSLSCVFLDRVLGFITALGDAGIIWIVTSILLICFKKTRKMGITTGVALLICLLVNNCFIKILVARPRPFVAHPDIVLKIPALSPYRSFMSGHAMSSFATATAILYYRRKTGIAAMAGAFVMAFSRLYFQVHYLTDVLAGAVAGVGAAFAAIYAVDKIYKIINERKKHNGTDAS